MAEGRKLAAPQPVGIEDDLSVHLILIIGQEQGAGHGNALFLADHWSLLAAGAKGPDQLAEQGPYRAGHAGLESGILTQNGGKQGGSRPQEARDNRGQENKS